MQTSTARKKKKLKKIRTESETDAHPSQEFPNLLNVHVFYIFLSFVPIPLRFHRLQTKGNKVSSFLRDCQDKPLVSMHSTHLWAPNPREITVPILQKLNGVISDGVFRTYYRSCQQDLCNGHNGRVYNSSGGAGTAGGTSQGGHLNAIIPGKSGCLAAKTGVLWLPLSLLLLPSLRLLHFDCN